jgi:hypothetical protein
MYTADKKKNKQTPWPLVRKNYTDWTTATCRRYLVPTYVDRKVSRGQRGGSHTAFSLSFLHSRQVSLSQISGFHGSDYKKFCLLGYDAVWLL